MLRPARTLLLWTAVWLTLGGRAAAIDPEPEVRFLYIEANEGDSSGGHAALRIGEEVFHFQYESRLLRLRRDDWSRFRHVYGRLGNRRIHAQHIHASPGTGTVLRDSFATRLLEEDASERLLREIERDLAFADARIAAGNGGDVDVATLEVPGAAYFGAEPARSDSPLRILADRLAAKSGRDFLAHRIGESERAIRALPPPDRDSGWIELATRTPLSASPGFTSRAEDRLARQRALELLATPRMLARDGLLAPEGDEFLLRPSERAVLERAAERLDARILALAASDRESSGGTLLVALARRAALSETLSGGRLQVLDLREVEPTGTRTLSPEALALLRDSVDVEIAQARAALLQPEGVGESELSRLELALARRAAVLDAAARGGLLALPGGPIVPGRAAALPLPRAASTPPEVEIARRARLEEARDALAGHFAAERRYALLTRNCVTELFRGIDRAFAEAGEDPVAASRSRLGGHVAAGAFARFIPFVADRDVVGRWRVTASEHFPSARDEARAAMQQDDSGLVVALRESNVLTSRWYRDHGGDSVFLFFTDESVLSRPLLGAFNLATGVATTAAGLFTWPFDQGTRLRDGGFGMLFSLPELGFVSLRKGTLAFAPEPPEAVTSTESSFAPFPPVMQP